MYYQMKIVSTINSDFGLEDLIKMSSKTALMKTPAVTIFFLLCCVSREWNVFFVVDNNTNKFSVLPQTTTTRFFNFFSREEKTSRILFSMWHIWESFAECFDFRSDDHNSSHREIAIKGIDQFHKAKGKLKMKFCYLQGNRYPPKVPAAIYFEEDEETKQNYHLKMFLVPLFPRNLIVFGIVIMNGRSFENISHLIRLRAPYLCLFKSLSVF